MYLFTQIQFVKRKDYYDVIVYYSKDGKKFRRSTGVRVVSKHILDSGGISSKHPNFEHDILLIKSVQDKIENLVAIHKSKYGEKPSTDWLEVEYEKKFDGAKKDLKHVLSYWSQFITEKRQTSRSEGSINRYDNLAGTLEKFSSKKNYVMDFMVLDQQFFNDFFNYMVNEHEYVRNVHQTSPEKGIKPEVGISNETAIKRVKDFIEYLKYCIVEHDVDIKLEKIKKYIKLAKHKIEIRPLSSSQKWELTFTLEELEFFINLEYYEPDFYESLTENKKRYLDILFFMCLQGTAPTDAKSIRRTDIKGGKIIKERNKTGNEFKVELDPLAQEILERNNYNLSFTDQTLNEELKRIFVTAFELYRKRYDAKHEYPYEIICIQKTKKGDRVINKIQHRGLFVELMTGRRTFITNLSEKAGELGLKETMHKAGHVKVATTLGYVHDRQQGKKETTNLFGLKKLPSRDAPI